MGATLSAVADTAVFDARPPGHNNCTLLSFHSPSSRTSESCIRLRSILGSGELVFVIV